MPAAFSRLQLAAALLEYDNDPDNPYAPHRSAQDSAIFANFRRNPAAPPRTSARQSDYLGVSLPSETGSLGGRESALDTRRSRGSIDALRNPFGADSNDEEEEAEEELEVDLTSWGLDAFMPKDKSRKGKGKAPSVAATAPPMTTVHSHIPSTNTEQTLPVPRRAVSYSRARSLGGSLDFLRETATAAQPDYRRRSIGSPLDVINMDPGRINLQRPRSSSAGFVQGTAEPSQGIPFPTGATRATSPSLTESIPGRRPHERTFSMASMNSRLLLAEVKEESRAQSTNEEDEEGSMKDDNPFALEPPAHTSRFDPKNAVRTRAMSNASIGTRALLNDDRNSVMTGGGENFVRERRYSTTLDLLRPKVLVMPSPLQSVAVPEPPPPDNRVRDGFTLSKDGPPMPPGARTSRRMSTLLSGSDAPPVASNSFIPNPLNDLTYAQKLFRNTLTVGGQSETYLEDLPRAMQDGEQAQLSPAPPEVEDTPPPAPPPPETTAMKRAPGKLYGKSLIDDLETRKAQMRNKQRVFTGDQRPSMMARPENHRSTLIDPDTLARPTSQFMNSSRLGDPRRRNSGNIKPLLSFDNDKIPQTAPIPNHPAGSRSVFGVDTLWEREMVKLREIEAQEKIEEQERKEREEEEERRKGEKKDKRKHKHKKKGGEQPQLPQTDEGLLVPQGTESRVSIEPPTLPVIERAIRRPPSPVDDDEEETDEDESAAASPRKISEPAWHAGSSDEEDGGPRRTTGVGPRYPTRNISVRRPADSDSDEDLPLAATLSKARKPFPTSRPLQLGPDEDEDEEKPLSSILAMARVKQPSSPLFDINFDEVSPKAASANNGDEGDDDEPLALRASRIPPAFNSGGNGGDDDDRPLALHPEQQRRTQFNMLAQQQQQMMMQTQLHNSMFFNPSMMGSGFFPPPIAAPMMNPVNPMMMMQPPMPIPSPPPIHDAAKFGRVDKWRRDVAVEGEP